MGDLGININSSEYDESAVGGQSGPMPDGVYKFVIERAEVKKTRDESGSYLSMMIRCTDGPQANRCVFPMITITNKSEKAVEIGKNQLAGLAAACGIESLSDSAQLLDKIVKARVYTKKDAQYGDKNQVGEWFDRNAETESGDASTDDCPF